MSEAGTARGAPAATTFLLHTRGPASRRQDLAEHLRLPGGAAFLVRSRGAGPVRGLEDHLHPPEPAPPPARAAPPTRAAPPPPTRAAPPPTRSAALRAVRPVGEARESERRILLDAGTPVVTLGPDDLPRSGRLSVALEWERPQTAGGVWSSTDVNLGCLWQTVAGHSGVVQSVGSLRSAPGFGARQVLRLGARSEDAGEALLVDATHLGTMARLLLFAYGSRSVPSWASLGVRLVVELPSGARVVLWLDDPGEGAHRCAALASVHVVSSDVIVRREAEYIDGPAREVALAYGWDLDWSADGTTPRT